MTSEEIAAAVTDACAALDALVDELIERTREIEEAGR